ncbi:hypothetical protein Pmani_038657 [Petrolisthes manimaculis]|uniref:Uncharacterized protein n=1 Tax=Petrolisthes manimaculis TaxID=1843537 RepID=A0AAE1TKA7_9EUCA|nr:hypothetical protein Pmani_038657 [Petrolisthes manimaculis]
MMLMVMAETFVFSRGVVVAFIPPLTPGPLHAPHALPPRPPRPPNLHHRHRRRQWSVNLIRALFIEVAGVIGGGDRQGGAQVHLQRGGGEEGKRKRSGGQMDRQ